MVEIATQALVHLTFRDVDNKRRMGGWEVQGVDDNSTIPTSSSSRSSNSSSVVDRTRAAEDAAVTRTVFPTLVQVGLSEQSHY